MMKKIFVAFVAALALLSCGPKDNPDTPGGGGDSSAATLEGIWELSSVTTKAAVGGLQVSVYLEFTASGSFTLYQKIGEGRYTKFTGSYALSSDKKLSGTYTGGEAWGPYGAEIGKTSLVLTSSGGKEVDTYTKIKAIPDSVLSNLY